MPGRDDMNKVGERVAKTAWDSYQRAVDHAVGLQERNVRFAQALVEGSIRELRQQSESNLAVTQGLVERAEEQGEAFRVLLAESVGAYMGFLCACPSPTTRRA